jgi:hypothetical protein
MEFDAIIACGCDYTEGWREVSGFSLDDTWPALLAKHFNVPYENLGHSFASNYQIAMQPFYHQQKHYNNPLYIFNFTMDYRYPIFDPEQLTIDSISSIHPEWAHMHEWGPANTISMKYLLDKQVANYPGETAWHKYHCLHASHATPEEKFTMKKLEVDAVSKENHIDGYQHLTKEAILLAHRVTVMNPHAKIMWGFIFGEYEIGQRSNVHIRNNKKVLFPKIENCYNNLFEDKYLHEYIASNGHVLNTEDLHPNKEGINMLKNLFVDAINTKFK